MFWFHLAATAWLTIGALSLIIYLRTWVDTPPLWFWPVIILAWPMVWTGGIIHPLR